MASDWKIFLLLSAFSTLQCVAAQLLVEFNDESIRSATEQQQVDDSTNEGAPPKRATHLPLKREHWAIICAAISLCFALLFIIKYMCWPKLRYCGCREVELQPSEANVRNRELKPQYSWDTTNHI
ncbi:PREDICTED: uncharacterized protein LOC108379481 [Rhagoletis zephyria]|uniref:uncharacterized protein LOC108379481 n=1 Tax=Rhagoletis zephyria TaxID=28612 RepID=UPI000811A4A0|nr:PREDICTED: uncharacterized protein LOC108379481 [Rhagoletis zephyria]